MAMAMATAELEAAIAKIPEKKESLREAFEALRAHSSVLASFALQWTDLDQHLSSIEASIHRRLEVLKAKEAHDDDDHDRKEPVAPQPQEPEPRPELRSLCAKMDAKGLRAFIRAHRKDLAGIRNELTPAVRSAPDPAKLVLDSMDGFYPSKPKADKDPETQAARRTCINLLERVEAIAPEIKPPVREMAKKLAAEWKGKMSATGGENGLEAMGLLQLLLSYGLVSEFEPDEVLDLLVLVARRKQTVHLCKKTGLADRVPDLIQKLNNKGRQLDAVKFAYAFNLVEKYPPVPLLKAYVKESKKAAQEVRNKGNNSNQSQNEAVSKEIGALRSVLKAVEDYKLESEYPREYLEKQIAKLERKKAYKKRNATAAAAAGASNSKSQQQQQQSNKRPRLSASTSTPVAVSHHALPPMIQNQPPLGLADRAYMGLAGSYGLPATGSLYNHAGQSLSGAPIGLGGIQTPPRSYLYASESLAGTGGFYDRPVKYGGYPTSGLPPYSSSPYH